jgi:hypothetical protein
MAEVPDTDGVYLVPAFVGLGAPYWDPRARGVIVGLTRNTKMAHIARAAVDAMAYQTRDVLEVMQLESGLPLTTLKVDGGAAANATLLQFQADLLGVPVRRPVVGETTALGAAYLAGLAVGYWNGLDDVRRNWALDREFRPSMAADTRDRLYAGWKKAVGTITRLGTRIAIGGTTGREPTRFVPRRGTRAIAAGRACGGRRDERDEPESSFGIDAPRAQLMSIWLHHLVGVQALREGRVGLHRDEEAQLQARAERRVDRACVDLEARRLARGEVQVRDQPIGLVGGHQPGAGLDMDQLRQGLGGEGRRVLPPLLVDLDHAQHLVRVLAGAGRRVGALIHACAEGLRHLRRFGVGVGHLQRHRVQRQGARHQPVVVGECHRRMQADRARLDVGHVGAERGQAVDGGQTLPGESTRAGRRPAGRCRCAAWSPSPRARCARCAGTRAAPERLPTTRSRGSARRTTRDRSAGDR